MAALSRRGRGGCDQAGGRARCLKDRLPEPLPHEIQLCSLAVHLRMCAGEPRFGKYHPHERAEVIEFAEYLDFEPTGGAVPRAREMLEGEAA